MGSNFQDHLPALLKGAPGQCDREEEGQARRLAWGPGPSAPSESVWERGAACSQEEVADGLGPSEVRLHAAGL